MIKQSFYNLLSLRLMFPKKRQGSGLLLTHPRNWLPIGWSRKKRKNSAWRLSQMKMNKISVESHLEIQIHIDLNQKTRRTRRRKCRPKCHKSLKNSNLHNTFWSIAVYNQLSQEDSSPTPKTDILVARNFRNNLWSVV